MYGLAFKTAAVQSAKSTDFFFISTTADTNGLSFIVILCLDPLLQPCAWALVSKILIPSAEITEPVPKLACIYFRRQSTL